MSLFIFGSDYKTLNKITTVMWIYLINKGMSKLSPFNAPSQQSTRAYTGGDQYTIHGCYVKVICYCTVATDCHRYILKNTPDKTQANLVSATIFQFVQTVQWMPQRYWQTSLLKTQMISTYVYRSWLGIKSDHVSRWQYSTIV